MQTLSNIILLSLLITSQVFSQEMDSAKLLSLSQAIDERLIDLSENIKFIGSKSNDSTEVEYYINMSIPYFSRNAYIMTKSATTGIERKYKPAPYFDHLRSLKYNHVNIWFDPLIPSQLKNKDGDKLTFVATIRQHFEGFGQNYDYKDYTEKNVEVIAKWKLDPVDGEYYWEIKIHDIWVSHIEKRK